MGLFGDIFSGFGGIAGQVVGAIDNKKAIKKASNAQIAAEQAAIDEQHRQYDTTRADYAPFLGAGTAATEQLRRLLGLGDSNTGMSVNGNPALSAQDQQAGALNSVRESPFFTGAYDTGVDSILQSASATGGLRGGNTENSLAQFGSGLFSSVLQQLIGNLGGLVSPGLTAAGGTAAAGTNAANNTSGYLVDQGNAKAGSILGRQAVGNQLSTSIQQLLSSVVGGGMKG